MDKNFSYNVTPIISVLNIGKIFTDDASGLRRTVLRDLSFQIRDITRSGINQGQIVCILGESGAGKSTLFKMIAGLDTPSGGSIKIQCPKNRELRNVEDGDIGFVQQSYPLPHNLTMSEFLLLASEKGGIPKNRQSEIISGYLDRWKLLGCETKTRSELSGGQKQRFAILSQILCGHKYIILDEPFSGLDRGAIRKATETLRTISLLDEVNTLIISTHDISIAVEIADTIIIIGEEESKEGSTILREYNLAEMGLAWATELSVGHYNLIREIEQIIIG